MASQALKSVNANCYRDQLARWVLRQGRPTSNSFHNPEFVVSVRTAGGEIMGVRHRGRPLHGVRFHPESFLTAEGPQLLRNFIELVPATSAEAGQR
jgi:hypothetical protein